MKKKFKSKVELIIFVPVAVILIVIETLMIMNQVWPLVILIACISAFMLYIYVDTAYVFTSDDKLRIKSGFLYKKEIYIGSIKRIKETRNILASPALSADRLEIFYNRYERVLISPDHKSEFISCITELNPRIKLN